MARLTVKELRRAMDIELEAVWYRLMSKVATLADRQADMAMRYDRMVDQVQTLTQLAKEQAEVIAALTDKLEELAESHNDLAEEMVRAHRRLDRCDARELQTFTLSGSNAARLDTHGAWIAELFRREEQHHQDEK